MRFPLGVRSGLLSPVALLISVLAGSMGSPTIAGDGFYGLVGGLADASDLTPLMATDARVAVSAAEASSTIRSTSLGRQSVPAADRAASYRDGEVFANSKVAVPLLVADLEPKTVSRARPMSGRSVGARPSAAWTRPRVSAGDVPKSQAGQPAMAWTSLGGR